LTLPEWIAIAEGYRMSEQRKWERIRFLSVVIANSQGIDLQPEDILELDTIDGETEIKFADPKEIFEFDKIARKHGIDSKNRR
jgi:hypothetical protein